MSLRDDVLVHISQVQTFMEHFLYRIGLRAKNHDLSKLEEDEFNLYSEFKPKIQAIEDEYGYGSPEYLKCVQDNWNAFEIHFERNRHHPEHFPNGVDDMNLVDIVEMLCDWKARSSEKGKPINLTKNQEIFGISDQLIKIFENTIRDFGW